MIRTVPLLILLLSPACMTDALAADAGRPAAGIPTTAAPMVVTSDTDAYCQTLARQINQRGESLPRVVVLLRDQGQYLCATGQVRGGINRLRRALMALRDPPHGSGEEEAGR